MDFALGELGLRPDDFWAMTWAEYDSACRGYQLRQAREWERTRQMGEWFAAFQGIDLRKELRGRRLLELPTDPPPDLEAAARKAADLKAYRDQLSTAQVARLQSSKPAP